MSAKDEQGESGPKSPMAPDPLAKERFDSAVPDSSPLLLTMIKAHSPGRRMLSMC